MGEIRWKDKPNIPAITGTEKMPVTDTGDVDKHVTPDQLSVHTEGRPAVSAAAAHVALVAGENPHNTNDSLPVSYAAVNYTPAAGTLAGHLQGIDLTFARVADGPGGVASPLIWTFYKNGLDSGVDFYPTDDGTDTGVALFNQILGVSVEALGDPVATSVDSIAGDFKTVTVKHGDTGVNRSLWVTIVGIINPAAASAITTETGDPLETEGGDAIEF